MDSQRPFLYLTLIFIGFLLVTTWNQDKLEGEKAATAKAQVAETLPTPDNGQTQTLPVGNPADVPTLETPADAVGSMPESTVQAAALGTQILRVRTDVLDLQISTKGGEIRIADLPSYPISIKEEDKNNPVRILDANGKNYVAQSGLKHQAISGQDTAKLAPNHLAGYQVEKTQFTLADGEDTLVVPMVWKGENGVVVTKRYTFKRGSFAVDIAHEINNQSNQIWSGAEYRQLKHGPAESQGNMLMMRAFNGGAYYHEDSYKRIKFDDMGDGKLKGFTETGGWIASMEHYFLSAWAPPQDEVNQYYSMENRQLGVPTYILGMQGPVKQIAAGASDSFHATFWVGPKLQDDLEAIAAGLDLTADYGIFAFISKPIFWLMQMIHNFVGNWGWTIIVLTLLIKLVFFLPSAMSYKAMAKMKLAAPKMKEISDRYASDPQGKQKAMMDLYKKEKLNPMGGCLPILIQLPVFMGLYWVLVEAVELRQAPWILWYQDLSIMDPYLILPILMGVSMFVQQKLNPPQVDPMQQKIFQFLPFIFTFMFLWFPAGLVLYWVVNNVLSIAQQWYINKKVVGHA